MLNEDRAGACQSVTSLAISGLQQTERALSLGIMAPATLSHNTRTEFTTHQPLQRARFDVAEAAVSASSSEDDSDDSVPFEPLSQADNRRPRPAPRPRSALANGNTASTAGHQQQEHASLVQPHLGPQPPDVTSLRTFHDRVHGQVDVPALLVRVIDTPEFQRLRTLKQLGGSNYVFPGAVHTRFEHCLGVAVLAGRLVKQLKRRQPELGITQSDVLCVQLAGLCHDLGHGPFSHTFEVLVNRVRRHAQPPQPPWHHELASEMMLRKLFPANGIELEAYGLCEADLNFAAALIEGLDKGEEWPTDIGRGREKRFLFDIVANKRNGLDVDKLDYFVRDGLCAVGRTPLDCDVQRILRHAKVFEVDGEMQICFEEKIALSIFDAFKLRAWLHKYLYQHRTVNVIEDMICDVLESANDQFDMLRDSDGAVVRISDCVDNMDVYMRLGDWILNAIEASAGQGLSQARAILQRIRTRDLYPQLGAPCEVSPSSPLMRATPDVVAEQVLSFIEDADERATLREALLVHFVEINYGSRDGHGRAINPLRKINFFNPKIPGNPPARLDVRKMSKLFIPQCFQEKLVYCYSRCDDAVERLEEAYAAWRAKLNHPTPIGAENSSPRRRRKLPGLAGSRTPLTGSPKSLAVAAASSEVSAATGGSVPGSAPQTPQ
eukprot:m.173762 g.173762  ORF g.173762 m.173762 type:complete len:664 (-) comp17877_c0_seq4:14-2005(-)